MIVNKRGKNIALVGTVGQVLFCGATVAVYLMTGSLAALSSLVLTLGGLGVWIFTAVLFYCRQLERQEAAELEQIDTEAARAQTIFQSQADRSDTRPAASRRAWIEKWLAPIVTLVWVLYLVGTGIITLQYFTGIDVRPMVKYLPAGILITFLQASLAFMFSRYCTGMSTQAAWRPLRAPGSFLLLTVLVSAGVLASLISASMDAPAVDYVTAIVISAVMLLLAAELAISQIMEFYRPRVPGQEHRFSYDSRLCNLLAEPGKVGHSLAETLNYQFGFEVSKTWFYRLFIRAVLPLAAFGVIVLIAMTSLVFVGDGQRVVLLHWGQADMVHRPLLEPGLHFKWPWPIDRADRFSISEVREVWMGVAGTPGHDDGHVKVWTKAHHHAGMAERNFVLAAPPRPGADKAKSPAPVDVIKLVAVLKYVVVDPYDHAYLFQDTQKVIECIANREMTRYCASATLLEDVANPNRPMAIMTHGRLAAANTLAVRINRELIEFHKQVLRSLGRPVPEKLDAGLGVHVTHVMFTAVHPPPEAAEAFEEVHQAYYQINQERFQAEASANSMLAEAAGSPDMAFELALRIRLAEDLKVLADWKGTQANLLDQIDMYLFKVTNEIDTLDTEIASDRLLGKPVEFKLQYRDEHIAYRRLLQRTREGREGKGKPVDLPAELAAASRASDAALDRAVGRAAAAIAMAEGRRWQDVMGERSRLAAYQMELPAYLASKRLYMLDRWMDTLDRTLPGMPKYVLAVDPDKVEIRLNTERASSVTAGLEGVQQDNK